MGRCGVAGRPLADVGQSGENGKMGLAQEAHCVFIITKKNQKNRIDLIRRGPS
jgi:hypothetical protein